jgi:sulfate permease, SulP family
VPRRSLKQLYREEFAHYNGNAFRQDLLAGLTVAAVALPLALAFGVASGATAAAGLVTAVVAGFVIGLLSGAPYQISGPTGAMSAILIVLAQRYGLSGMWTASVLAGMILLAIGLLRLGRFIAFIPAPVMNGFTSGIALIIFVGQIDNFLGIKTAAADSTLIKLSGYFHGGFIPDARTLALGALVVTTMLLWPKTWNARFPASLLGIVLVTLANVFLQWPVATIGQIPQTLLLADRWIPSLSMLANVPALLAPAATIAALCAVESLLCGAVASNMTGIRLQANQELVAQGVGNIVIPFFGGVPATAAIARTSVGIKSGGRTRLVSIIHAMGLLLSMFLLAPVMARIPVTALAGVLMVTAARMSEWDSIRAIFGRRFKTAMATFLVTLLATISLDLTQAILIGVALSAVVFINQIASLEIDIQEVDPAKLQQKGVLDPPNCSHVRVAFLTGPLFFAATGSFHEAFAHLGDECTIVLSMRGVPMVDTSGLEAIYALQERMRRRGGTLMFAGVHDNVRRMLERGGLVGLVGEQNFFWSSDQAILEAGRRGCR